MILVFTDDFDYSSIKVLEYLHYLGEDVERINIENSMEANISVNITKNNSLEIIVYDKVYNLKNIKSIWFRRGGFYMKPILKNQIKFNKTSIQSQINTYFYNEQKTLNKFIYETILSSKIRVLGNPLYFNTEKLSVLKKAFEIGFKIPETLVTTRQKEVLQFSKLNGTLITKAIQDNIKIKTGKSLLGNYTEEITHDQCYSLPEIFSPSLFQRKIKKKYEVRSFYLINQFYSIAIFSQENEKTKVDFRNYDKKLPNRKAPITLPVNVENRLAILLESLRLNTASIDLIVDDDGNYVFLEINPVGQYDMVGKLANYQLDKKIALWLANR